MEISEQLRCLFSAEVEARDGSYVLDVPKRELETGDLREGQPYRVAILPTGTDATSDGNEPETDRERDRGDGRVRGRRDPPVEEGEHRTVEIEDIGEQGDGITRVERGYVVIVPDTELRERVEIEITNVRENVAFAEVVGREEHYD
jgi:predicted RNA-binding protein with TRAM domain